MTDIRRHWEHLFADPKACPILHIGATPERVAREVAGIAYLATPYSKVVIGSDGLWDYSLSLDASARASRAAARLAALNITALSPIVMAAEMCHNSPALAPLDAIFWMRWCRPMLDAAVAVVVPDIPGWCDSAGIWVEVATALDRNKPVFIYSRSMT